MNMKLSRVRSVLFIAILAAWPLAAAVQAQSVKTGATIYRSIRVLTQPGASVWVDGLLFGRADKQGNLEIKTITAGGHVIKVRSAGYSDITRSLLATQKGDIKIPFSKTADEAETAFQEGEKLSSTDREKAIAAYRKAAKLRPGYTDALIALARALTEAGDYDEAHIMVAAARKAKPGLAEASAVEGRLFKEGGEEEKAIAAFKRAIKEGKGIQAEAYTGLGLLFKEKGEGFGASGDFDAEAENYVESAKYLKTALTQLSGAPDSVVVYQLLGLIYEREHRYADAIAIYEEFLRLFPNSNEASAVRSFIEQIKIQMKDQD